MSAVKVSSYLSYEEILLQEFDRFKGDTDRGMFIRTGEILQFFGRNEDNPLMPSQKFQDFIALHGWAMTQEGFLDYICIRPVTDEVKPCA